MSSFPEKAEGQHDTFTPAESPATGSRPRNQDSLSTTSSDLEGDEKPTRAKTTQSQRRAEQNRAAQRAFRERNKQYVKKLHERVQELEELTKNKYGHGQTDSDVVRSLREQNFEMRGTISRLLADKAQLQTQIYTMSTGQPPPPVSYYPVNQGAPAYQSYPQMQPRQYPGPSNPAHLARNVPQYGAYQQRTPHYAPQPPVQHHDGMPYQPPQYQ